MNRLMVFAKAPTPGRVKTRLQPPLTPSQAAELHGAFVRDVVARHDRADRTLSPAAVGFLTLARERHRP